MMVNRRSRARAAGLGAVGLVDVMQESLQTKPVSVDRQYSDAMRRAKHRAFAGWLIPLRTWNKPAGSDR
jgi:hypothetical protein